MQMVDGPGDQQLLYVVVTPRSQVDVLEVSGFLFMENFLDEELDGMAEILFALCANGLVWREPSRRLLVPGRTHVESASTQS